MLSVPPSGSCCPARTSMTVRPPDCAGRLQVRGASTPLPTVTVTVTVVVSTPSVTSHVKVTTPEKPAGGAYVATPPATVTAPRGTPWASTGAVALPGTTVRVSAGFP